MTEPALAERVGTVALTDGAVAPGERARITAFFDPDRAAEADLQARGTGEEPPRVLVSTDVLAEGHNLQLADTVVNFDLHFNPQVAVQRAGRVDRLNSPHPVVRLVSMLPPEALDRHIGLLGRLDERFRRIHGLGLGDEKVMPLAADVQGQTLEQIRRLYADDASVLDRDRALVDVRLHRLHAHPSRDLPQHRWPRAARRDPDRRRIGQATTTRLAPRRGHLSRVRRARLGRGAARDLLAVLSPPVGRLRRRRHDDVEIFRAIACDESEPRAVLHDVPDGPGIFDWDLVGRAARELAEALTLRRSQAELQRGASERSRRLRNELRVNAAGLDIEGLDDLLERLLQVRVEDYDARSGWRAFGDARRALRRAETEGERFRAAADVAQCGLDLLGGPVAEDEDEALTEVAAQDLQLVAYEALVAAPGSRAPGEQATLGV